jgi:hypothetical protein
MSTPAKRRFSQQAVSRPSQTTVFRGSGQKSGEEFGADANLTGKGRERVLAVKVEINWGGSDATANGGALDGKQLYNRLRDLGWQAARYRNIYAQRLYAERMGWRKEPEKEDPHDLTKQARATEKGELSGAAYSAAEREVTAAFTRDIRRILAGQPIPTWRPTSALTVRGHKKKADSGIRLEIENDCFVAYLAAQSQHSQGGCWLRLPIAKNTRRDEYQGELLQRMVSWAVPILKAGIQIKQHGVILRLTYRMEKPPLPPMGERIATLGPATNDGRLLLRTESQTRDYSSKLATVLRRKDEWDLIRRRALAQIGWRRGQARAKRRALARLSWDDWLQSYLHTWSRDLVSWSVSQGVGTIRLESISTGDWPADRLKQMIQYKAADFGIKVVEGADIASESGMRSAEATIRKQQRRITKRRQAERELEHQLR